MGSNYSIPEKSSSVNSRPSRSDVHLERGTPGHLGQQPPVASKHPASQSVSTQTRQTFYQAVEDIPGVMEHIRPLLMNQPVSFGPSIASCLGSPTATQVHTSCRCSVHWSKLMQLSSVYLIDTSQQLQMSERQNFSAAETVHACDVICRRGSPDTPLEDFQDSDVHDLHGMGELMYMSGTLFEKGGALEFMVQQPCIPEDTTVQDSQLSRSMPAMCLRPFQTREVPRQLPVVCPSDLIPSTAHHPIKPCMPKQTKDAPAKTAGHLQQVGKAGPPPVVPGLAWPDGLIGAGIVVVSGTDEPGSNSNALESSSRARRSLDMPWQRIAGFDVHTGCGILPGGRAVV